MTSRRIVITGMGAVSSLGQGLEATWSALESGRSGISQLDRTVDAEGKHRYVGPAGVAPPLDGSDRCVAGLWGRLGRGVHDTEPV